MAVLYRHMAKQYCDDAVTLGRLRLGSSDYYHSVENAPAGVEDDLEFRTKGTHQPISFDARSRNQFTDAMSANFIKFENVGMVNMTNVQMVRQLSPKYLLCLSTDGQAGLFGADYDAVLRIEDADALARAIVECSNGELKGYCLGNVRYEAREFDIFNDAPLDADMFVKRPTFASQREFRIVFTPAGAIHPHIFVEGAPIAKHLQLEAS